MNRILLMLLLMLPALSHADEYYPFFSIKCAKDVSLTSIEWIGIWNIHEAVWPSVPMGDDKKEWAKSEWQAHEKALKNLEEKYGLFVFGEPYGRDTNKPYRCITAKYQLNITADLLVVDDDGTKRLYRGLPKVAIKALEGKLLYEGILDKGDSLHTDGEVLEICNAEFKENRKNIFNDRVLSCQTRSLIN